MSRLKPQIIWGMLVIVTWIEGIFAHSYRINTTIYDTNLAHVTYSDMSIKCDRWARTWVFWKVCDSWIKPWTSGIYHFQGKKSTFHSSLNHQSASVSIEFKGTDVWVYGPPLSQLAELPPDYRICLHESYHLSSRHQCYQTKTAKAYSAIEGEDEPVVIFSRGQLQDHEHRIVISVADPVDNLQAYNGIQFSHVIYTTSRPTPWPVEEDHWRYREVVMHDTHPMLLYSPPVSSGRFTETPAWFAKVKSAEDGTVMSWHELKSCNGEDRDQWGIKTKIKAGAVTVYGVPSAYIENQDSLGFVCVQLDLGLCETVDLRTIYANQKYHARHEPVLLWHSSVLDPSRETHVFIRLVKVSTGTGSIFPFKSLSYFEEKEYPSPGPLVGELENVTVNHDDQAILYNPEKRCISQSWYGVCLSWFEPWETEEVGPPGSILTYRSTHSQYRVKEDPHITLNFRGSSVYLYGAPNAYAARLLAPQHVCLNNVCRIIDVEQAYLHQPPEDLKHTGIRETQGRNVAFQGILTPLSSPHPELEPVLIWATDGLDNNIEHTLRLALAPLPSQDDSVMSIVKIVYTKVTYRRGQDRPDPPTPNPDHVYSGPLEPSYATGRVLLDQEIEPSPPISTKHPTPISTKRPAPISTEHPAPISTKHPAPILGPFAFILLVAAFLVAYAFLNRLFDHWKPKIDEIEQVRSNTPPPNHTRQQLSEILGRYTPATSSPPSRRPNATDNTLPGTRRERLVVQIGSAN